MVLDQVPHGFGLLNNSQSCQPHDAWVRETAHKDERAKVLVHCYEYASLLVCKRKQEFVGGVRVSIRSRKDVMASVGKLPVESLRCGANIEKEFHEAC